MMSRLTKLQVTNFRSIKGTITVPLDAPVVLIHGPNGSGKTSLLSALELGLTGAVDSLGRFDEAYEENLVHYDADRAEISISTDHMSTILNDTELSIEGGAITGSPLLTPSQCRFFTERAFLAQSTLGRLLEIYEESDVRDAASPLTRFVKDLLGLDRLDALIEGLKPSTDKRLTKRSLPLYGDVEAEHKRLKIDVDQLNAEIEDAKRGLREDDAVLARSLLPFSLQPSEDLAGLLTALGKDGVDNSEQIDLSALRREVEAASSLWQKTDDNERAPARALAEIEVRDARRARDVWAEIFELRLETAFKASASLISNPPSRVSVGWGAAATASIALLAGELRRGDETLGRDEAARVSLETKRTELEKSRARIMRLEEELATLSADNGALARALSELAPMIDGNACPVCERDFSEVSDTALHAHLTRHIARLSQTAIRLQEVSTERQSVSRAILSDEREIEALTGRIINNTERTHLRTRASRLREAKQALVDLAAPADQGDILALSADDASKRLANLRRDEEMLSGIRRSVREFPVRLNIAPAVEDEGTTATLSRCLAVVEQRQNALSLRSEERRKAIDALERAKLARKRLSELESEHAAAKQAAERTKDALVAADNIKKSAKDLLDRAIAARTDTVRDVFNDSLNKIWKNLFIRLAPEEPFQPSFELPPPGRGPVEAKLVTRYRGEHRGGNPKAMLSAGNLNTAALTLFLSLHLSVKPVLPWLVIDDPVQSMDEIHIAQFAALLRTLSKQRERQVIIAVHEKPLFDYLALELGPAAQGDRLITIELAKGTDGHTIYEPNTIEWDPDRVFQAVVG